jgi:hypothetical protein
VVSDLSTRLQAKLDQSVRLLDEIRKDTDDDSAGYLAVSLVRKWISLMN